MPSVSKSQQNLMRAAAHTKGGFGGVPQDVGKDFDAADKREGTRYGKPPKSKKSNFRKG